mmetsp:Transcript_93146/g.114087  ORF Transcript_93146/g.114087 Transcript_93146/m.114087 type:complete len:156 (+) Transcript_93146:46-513(+)
MGNTRSNERNEMDRLALERYFKSDMNDAALNILWKQYDSDGNGLIDSYELNNIIFHMLVQFWLLTENDKTLPNKDELKPIISDIKKDILNKCNGNTSDRINRKEFTKVGDYLKKQYKIVQKKIKRKEQKKQKLQVNQPKLNILNSMNSNSSYVSK